MDGDDPDHISWLFERASARANEFGIEGVTWSLTQGVVKNIVSHGGRHYPLGWWNVACLTMARNQRLRSVVTCSPSPRLPHHYALAQIPAIASTNAIIAAASCNEAFKIATSSASYLSNYM